MLPETKKPEIVERIEKAALNLRDLRLLLQTQNRVLKSRGASIAPEIFSGLESVEARLRGLESMVQAQVEELDRLQALAETTALINSSLDIEEVLNGVMDTIIGLTEAERGYIVMRNEDTGEMEFRVARNLDREAIDSSSRFIVSRTIVARVAQSGDPIVTTNAQEDPNFSQIESIAGYGLRSILCVPLKKQNGDVMGVMYADNRIRAGLFAEKELQLLVAFANQASVAIENARLFESVTASLRAITEMTTLMDNVFESIASGVITTDIEDSVTMYNRAAENILRIRRAQAENQPFANLRPYLVPEHPDILDQVRHSHQTIALESTHEIPRRRGRVYLNLHFSALESSRDTGRLTGGVTVVVNDLTELKARESQIAAVGRYLPPAMIDQIKTISELDLGGVRREISIVFTDVRPLTTFNPQLRPTQLMESLNFYLTDATEAIHELGGIVDKYMGNEIMAIFNTQLNPLEDHILRAVQTAIHTAHTLQALNYRIGDSPDEVYYRIGIHTGVATLGNIGNQHRQEFTAIGDTVNLAKRLQESAAPGQILISEDVYGIVKPFLNARSDVEAQPLPPVRVKGRQQLTQMYNLKVLL